MGSQPKTSLLQLAVDITVLSELSGAIESPVS